MSTTRIAQCSCGGISVTVNADPRFTVLCHCIQCQRRTGSPFGVGIYFRREDVRLEGVAKSHTRKVEGTDRSVTNDFCPECGGTIYWTLDFRPQHIGIAAGNFADPEFGRPNRRVWTQHKHDWIILPPEIPTFPQVPP
jgi:hypothetical protein